MAKISKRHKEELKHSIAAAIKEDPDSGICKRLLKIAVENYSKAIGWGYSHPNAVRYVLDNAVSNVSVRT